MASRSLNKVLLIGNLTRDPELRYTPSGSAVVTFGLATNRSWTTEGGEKHDDTEFHNVVAWNRLAEICAEYLTKGKQVYVEGRLSTREWEGQDGQKRRTTEIIAETVIFLGSSGAGAGMGTARGDEFNVPDDLGMAQEPEAASAVTKPSRAPKTAPASGDGPAADQEVSKLASDEVGEDIPF